jgi:hypothetical protein
MMREREKSSQYLKGCFDSKRIQVFAIRMTDVPFGSITFAAAASKESSFGSSRNSDGGHLPLLRVLSITFIMFFVLVVLLGALRFSGYNGNRNNFNSNSAKYGNGGHTICG